MRVLLHLACGLLAVGLEVSLLATDRQQRPDSSSYVALLNRYESGDYEGAADNALSLDENPTSEALALLLDQANRGIADVPLTSGGTGQHAVLQKRRLDRLRLLRLAAALHTEGAFRASSSAALAQQLALARLAIDHLKKLETDFRENGPILVVGDATGAGTTDWEATELLIRDWYLAVASQIQAAATLDDLNAHLASGLAEFPNEPELLLARGTASEQWAAVAVIDPSVGTKIYVPGLLAQWRRFLGDAERDFQRALSNHADLHEAQLRLGRVRSLLGDRPAARNSFGHVAASDAAVQLRYFAWLFLGELADAENDRIGARRAYEEALRLVPDSQVPLLAMSNVCDTEADDRCARTWLDRALAQPSRSVDPWRNYLKGQAWLGSTRLATFRKRGLSG